MITQLIGDCRETLKTLDAGSVQCVVTSPPYFGLRSYLDADDDNKHREIGTERTPSEYVATMVQVFDEIWRVLRNDGCVWLNLGDSYASAWAVSRRNVVGNGSLEKGKRADRPNRLVEGLKEKDLIGIPWRVAFALQDAGWYLRSDVIWNKPNCMPESVTDRPTRAHEYIFLLTKRERYFYNADAIAEDSLHAGKKVKLSDKSLSRGTQTAQGYEKHWGNAAVDSITVKARRNRRTVWTVPTTPYSGAHFATFPEALIEPCILAGTSPQACEHCGAPWAPVVESKPWVGANGNCGCGKKHSSGKIDIAQQRHEIRNQRYCQTTTTGGYAPTCRCENTGSGRCVVLDPFGGSGTTGRVALKHGRRAILCELNPAYVALQDQRTDGVQVVLPLEGAA